MTGPYDDIISLPHPTSAKHPRMPLSDRAAQFAPFAALSGHSTALAETARLTDQRMELDEDARAALDFKTATAVGADQRAARNHGDLVPARCKERRRPVYRINREAEKNTRGGSGTGSG